jgi:hypothetical protein
MESNRIPSVLQFALEEERKLEARLQSNPDFQDLAEVRRVIALCRETEALPVQSQQIITLCASEHVDDDTASEPHPPRIDSPSYPLAHNRATRPRWAWRRSESAEIRREAETYLRQKGKRAHGTEISRALTSKGLKINSKQPSAIVCARLSSSRIFDHTEDGYGLADWSNDIRANPPSRDLEVVGDIIDVTSADGPRGRSEPISKGHDSQSDPIPDTTLPTPISRATRWREPHRGGWRKGHSESARIRIGASEFLREANQRASGGEIYAALKEMGITVNGNDPVTTVCCRLGRSDLFDHTDDGYGLVEWSQGRAVLPNGEK